LNREYVKTSGKNGHMPELITPSFLCKEDCLKRSAARKRENGKKGTARKRWVAWKKGTAGKRWAARKWG